MKPRSISSRIPHMGGIVTVTPIRDRLGECEDSFAISWHSPGGNLRWLSPRIPNHDSAEAAAAVLADFTKSVLAR